MEYKKLRANIKKEELEVLIGILLDNDIEGYEILDDSFESDPDGQDFEELIPDLEGFSKDPSVIFYLTNADDESDIISQIYKSIPEADISVSVENEDSWKDKWKEYFHSFLVGDILIKPSWEDYSGDKTVIEIDPGMAFGTGAHESTRLCIEELINLKDLSKAKFLDIGCGSGILSLVADKLGCTDITGIDITKDCIDTSLENFNKNNIPPDNYKLYQTNLITECEIRDDKLKDNGYDIICANILADILMELMPIFFSKLKSTGVLILSGIIDTKRYRVIACMKEAGFTVTDTNTMGEWCMVKGRK